MVFLDVLDILFGSLHPLYRRTSLRCIAPQEATDIFIIYIPALFIVGSGMWMNCKWRRGVHGQRGIINHKRLIRGFSDSSLSIVSCGISMNRSIPAPNEPKCEWALPPVASSMFRLSRCCLPSCYSFFFFIQKRLTLATVSYLDIGI